MKRYLTASVIARLGGRANAPWGARSESVRVLHVAPPDGGPDHPDWVGAVCANCHRRAHYSADKTVFNDHISERVKEKEARLQVGGKTGLG
jgi:hypothetical protein